MAAKTPLLTTGLNGLVGSKLAQVYSEKYEFKNLDIRDPDQPVDITQFDQVLSALNSSLAKFVVHLAAYTDVTGAWQQTGDESGLAYQVNVVGTQNVVEACNQTNKHLIAISTAYVFDGEKTEPYDENDQPNPLEWYGRTKWLAEQAVIDKSQNWSILRIDQPFRSDSFAKVDTAHRIINGLKDGSLPPQFSNHFFGPTFIDDFVKVIDWVIRTKTTGLFHASSGESWTDFEFAKTINEIFSLNADVKPGDINEYLKKIERPYQKNTALNCDKLSKQLDFSFTPIKEALKTLHQ